MLTHILLEKEENKVMERAFFGFLFKKKIKKKIGELCS